MFNIFYNRKEESSKKMKEILEEINRSNDWERIGDDIRRVIKEEVKRD